MGAIAKTLGRSFSGVGYFCGYGFFLASWKWYDITLNEYFGGASSSAVFSRMLFSFGLLVSAVICILLLRNKEELLSNKPYTLSVTASLLILSAITISIQYKTCPFPTDVTALIGLIRGFAIGGSVLLWVERFGLFPVNKAIAGLAIAYPVSVIALFYLLNLSILFAGITIVVFPLLSVGLLFYKRLNRDTKIKVETLFTAMQPSKSIEMLAWVVLVNAIFRIAMNYGIENNAALEFFQIGSLIPVMLAITFLISFPGKAGFQSMYRASLVLLAVGLLVFFSIKQISVVGQALVGSAYFAVGVTMLVVVVSYANLSKTSAAKGYAYVIIANAIGGFLAIVVTMALSVLGISLYDKNTIFLILAIALLLLVPFALRKESNLNVHFNTVDSALESNAQSITEATIYKALEKEYHLTKRESSVLFLHAKGHSQADIAKEMFIATGTVRAHYNNIYEKLSVHSREELNNTLAEFRMRLIENQGETAE
jgi:DNA-binding CsgD family transcriptional regulator